MKIVTMETSNMKNKRLILNIFLIYFRKSHEIWRFSFRFIQAMNNRNQGAGQVWTPLHQATNKEIACFTKKCYVMSLLCFCSYLSLKRQGKTRRHQNKNKKNGNKLKSYKWDVVTDRWLVDILNYICTVDFFSCRDLIEFWLLHNLFLPYWNS